MRPLPVAVVLMLTLSTKVAFSGGPVVPIEEPRVVPQTVTTTVAPLGSNLAIPLGIGAIVVGTVVASDGGSSEGTSSTSSTN